MKILIVLLLIIDLIMGVTAFYSVKSLLAVLDKKPEQINLDDFVEDDESAKNYVKSIEGIMNYDPYK